MNAKLLFKTIFLIIVLLLLVLMGMHNQDYINFSLPPLLKTRISQPAALMYFAFFAVGRFVDLVSLHLQRDAEARPEVGVVVYDQDVRPASHGGPGA